jgi:hypothetical protein
MYKTINFKEHKIYKIKIDGLDKELIKRDFEMENIFLNKTNCADNIMRKSIRDLYSKCYESIEHIYRNELDRTIRSGYQSGWILNCAPQDYTGNFHTHDTFSPKYPELSSEFTWTYYLEMPDNCVGDEGHLILKDGDETFSFLPEEGYLYTFKSNIPHRGQTSPNSTKNRLVIVGNISFNYE